MDNKYGPRGVIALHAPMQNINMQPEFEMLRPHGINNQIFRVELGASDEKLAAGMKDSISCDPDIVALGVSMEMHDWSVARQAQHRSILQGAIGSTPLVLAADATVTALRAVGARRISILSPMVKQNSVSARDYYQGMGFDVAQDHCLGVRRSADIPKLSDDAIVRGFEDIDLPDVDTLLHVGGALSALTLTQQLEDKHGKPVISVNAATYWMALRWLRVEDPMAGFGQLLKLPLPEGTQLQA